jgi:putative thioredoxin
LTAKSSWVFDADAATFDKEVLEKSRSVPVVLDFWAKWCGPCRSLGPMLESLAEEYGGKFLLAKVNIDEHPILAQQFRVESIPLVLGLFDGKVVAEFVGAQPESVVRSFLAKVVPSEAESLARKADELEATDPNEARALYERAIALDPRHSRALAGLAELALNAGDAERARGCAEKVPEGSDGWRRAENVRARLAFLDAAAHLGSVEETRARLEAEPGNLQRRVDLGLVLAAAGDFESALENLVGVVEADRAFGAEHAKGKIVQIFNILGQQNELTNRYRSRLAAALY